MGKSGGLAAKLRDKPYPTLFNIHCVCHRLALASTHYVADIVQVERVETNLLQLWKYFDNSPKRLSTYAKVQEKQKQVHLSTDGRKKVTKRRQKACKTRGLSFDKAVKAAREDLDCILSCLSELADDATWTVKEVEVSRLESSPVHTYRCSTCAITIIKNLSTR